MKLSLLSLVTLAFLCNFTQAQEQDIWVAAKGGNLAKVTELVLNDPDIVKARESVGLTPLHYAAFSSVDVVSFLVEHGADVNAVGNKGFAPLFIAARFGNVEMAKYLLEHGAILNIPSQSGTPMHFAVYKSPVELVTLFLDNDADLTITDSEGSTPLHIASTWNVQESMELLIAAGADINAKDNNGNTPLHRCFDFASETSPGSFKVAEALIKHKALLNEKNNNGLTPLGLAKQFKGTVQIIKMLEEAGAKQ